jgi:hypothetical protein
MEETIINPLLSCKTVEEHDIKNFNDLYIITFSNNKINEAIYFYTIPKNTYTEILKDLILIKVPISVMINNNYIKKGKIMSDILLNNFNKNNYKLDEKNLVLQIFNISIEDIKLYISQFYKNRTMIDLYKMITLNKYFNNVLVQQKIVSNIEEATYWTNPKNCFNIIKNNFNKRRLLKFSVSNDNNNYLNEIENYSTSTEVRFYTNNNNIFTKEDIYSILLNLDDKNRYFLFCNLLVSKSYCHLVINNKEVLDLMNLQINKYYQLFRYLIGYAWIRFYCEELNKKTYITKTDQFIFDIDTASSLPLYPFSIKYPKMNPYCPIMINDDHLNSEYNIGGVYEYKYKNNTNLCTSQGIATLEVFRENLKVFCGGDIFKNIDWAKNKMALTGSTLCACVQDHHPLMDMFLNYPIKERLKRYFNEYYADSDLDIMILTNNVDEFIINTKNIYNQIVINLCENNQYVSPDHIKLNVEKFAYLFITDEDIDNVLKTNNTFCKDYIKNNLEKEEIKNLFLDLYNLKLELYKSNFNSKLDESKEYLPEYLDFSSLIFKLRLSKNTNVYDVNIGISYKYKIVSPHLDHSLEIFMVKYNDFFATVQTFHLPCVRMYYDGTNLYMTPSCVSAHLTYMNLDFRYFAGNSDPGQIINKYRMRGFGTWLNEHEKTSLIKYSKEDPFWNNLYNINLTNMASILNNLGSLKCSHKLFQPRLYNMDYYYNLIPIDLQKGYDIPSNDNTKTFVSIKQFLEEISNDEPEVITIMSKLQSVSVDGNINPLQKWIIEAIWEIKNLSSENNTVKFKSPIKL